MWTIELVMARFCEAVDIERRMFVKGMPGCGNGWPSYQWDTEDRAGWDDAARLDALEQWQGRKVTKSLELTRWEEVYYQWTMMIPERRRSLIWRWSECIALGRSFSAYCERKGLIRATAYNRRDRVFEDLVSQLRLEARVLNLPDEKWTRQFEARNALRECILENVAPKTGPLVHPPYRSEKHHDNLTSPEAVAEFSKHLSSTNDARRRSQARKREKALRGVPGEQEAA